MRGRWGVLAHLGKQSSEMRVWLKGPPLSLKCTAVGRGGLGDQNGPGAVQVLDLQRQMDIIFGVGRRRLGDKSLGCHDDGRNSEKPLFETQ